MARCSLFLRLAPPVAVLALLWALVPQAGSPATELQAHARLLLNLFGVLPKVRDGKYGQREPPARRPSDGGVPEVQGFVDPRTFKEKYLWKGPVVFRGAATAAFGFDLGCLAGPNATDAEAMEALIREMGESKVRVFKDQYDDASAEYMTIKRYADLAERAKVDPSEPTPYARAYPQNSMPRCQPVPSERMKQYRSLFGWAAQSYLPEPDTSVVFASFSEGTNTKMHMDIGDTLFTQVYGRKRWLLAGPEYATSLKIYGDRLNLVYISGFDVHREPLPDEVFVQEVILNPGDVLYFPPMTFHSAYNLDPVVIGIDNAAFDAAGSFLRHWLLTSTTLFNPRIVYKTLAMLAKTGSFTCTELYFDGFSSKSKERPAAEEEAAPSQRVVG